MSDMHMNNWIDLRSPELGLDSLILTQIQMWWYKLVAGKMEKLWEYLWINIIFMNEYYQYGSSDNCEMMDEED